MPIFVMRQWIRHRTANVNECSARYSVLPAIFYTPEKDRHNIQSKVNKQGGVISCIDDLDYERIDNKRNRTRKESVELYQKCLTADLERGVARIDLPVSIYTYIYWKMDVRNLLHFLRLRLDEHAQWEIREYARVIAGIVKEWLPITWEAFDDYVRGGMDFSRQEQAILSMMINTGIMTEEEIEFNGKDLNMSKNEINDFIKKVDLLGCKEMEDVSLNYDNVKDASYFEEMIEKNKIEY